MLHNVGPWCPRFQFGVPHPGVNLWGGGAMSMVFSQGLRPTNGGLFDSGGGAVRASGADPASL